MILELLLCTMILVLALMWDMATTIGKVNGVAEASIAKVNGVAKSVHKIYGIAFPDGSPTIVFDETWSSCTPGDYQDDPITGADESGWDIAGGGAGQQVTVPNPASTYVILDGSGGDVTLKNLDIKGSSTYNVFGFDFSIPATNGGYIEFYLFNANADEKVCGLKIESTTSILCNGNAYNPGLSADTFYQIYVTIDYTNKEVTFNVNGTDRGPYAWSDSTGTDGDMKRMEIYVSSNANNLKKLGNFWVGNGVKP